MALPSKVKMKTLGLNRGAAQTQSKQQVMIVNYTNIQVVS